MDFRDTRPADYTYYFAKRLEFPNHFNVSIRDKGNGCQTGYSELVSPKASFRQNFQPSFSNGDSELNSG